MNRERSISLQVFLGPNEKRLQAIRFVQWWADQELAGYPEPTRKGTLRGEPVGFSIRKLHAAILMILYPRIKLGEIASIIKVPLGVLRVWRTQDDFKISMAAHCEKLGMLIANTIDYHLRNSFMEGTKSLKEVHLFLQEDKTIFHIEGKVEAFDLIGVLTSLLAFLHPAVLLPIQKMLWVGRFSTELVGTQQEKEELFLGPYRIAAIMMLLASLREDKQYQAFIKSRDAVRWYKGVIGEVLDDLTNPEYRQEIGEEGLQKGVATLKEFISSLIEILAK